MRARTPGSDPRRPPRVGGRDRGRDRPDPPPVGPLLAPFRPDDRVPGDARLRGGGGGDPTVPPPARDGAGPGFRLGGPPFRPGIRSCLPRLASHSLRPVSPDVGAVRLARLRPVLLPPVRPVLPGGIRRLRPSCLSPRKAGDGLRGELRRVGDGSGPRAACLLPPVHGIAPARPAAPVSLRGGLCPAGPCGTPPRGEGGRVRGVPPRPGPAFSGAVAVSL